MAKLPTDIVTMLATRDMREHHDNWHLVRRPDLLRRESAQRRAQLRSRGWIAPRAQGDSGSGIDFLYMHRKMIEQVNAELARIADPQYPQIEGWTHIPSDPVDPDWPVPDWPGAPSFFTEAKSEAALDQYLQLASERYTNEEWLATVTLDELGREIESGIHGWFHLRWSAPPWFTGDPAQQIDDPANDFLGDPYSSHVNEVFWKLHGWIDDRITQWEVASGEKADWQDAWDGPPHIHHVSSVDDADSHVAARQQVRTDFFAPVDVNANFSIWLKSGQKVTTFATEASCDDCIRGAIASWAGHNNFSDNDTLANIYLPNHGACNQGAIYNLATLIQQMCGFKPVGLRCDAKVAHVINANCP